MATMSIEQKLLDLKERLRDTQHNLTADSHLCDSAATHILNQERFIQSIKDQRQYFVAAIQGLCASGRYSFTGNYPEGRNLIDHAWDIANHAVLKVEQKKWT